ncbi:hypothetical protein [Demequina flava]|uniref:hypothetical protein n=1 Tax=Demequina flava TaxID=1095025 RepID=UPI0007849929|nr:hypothetical protein [Demequina flava]
MRLRLLIIVPTVALVLSACTGSESSEGETTTSVAPTGSTVPTASADADASGSDSGTEDGGIEGDAESGADESGNDSGSEPDDAMAAGIDPYCEPALAGAKAMGDLLDATDRKSAQTGVDGDGGSVAEMNAAGTEMLAASAIVADQWSEAAGALENPAAPTTPDFASADVEAALTDIETYLTEWVNPEAEIAASAGSIAEYDQATVALLSDASVVEAASAGGEGLSVVLPYTLERCGELPDL